MTFKPAIWFPIAVLLSAANVVAVWFAALPAEPLHATIHAGLAVAFGVWARRLRQPPGGNELGAGFDALELEINELRQELMDARERLNFAERMLAEPEPRRADSERRGPLF